MSKINYKIKSLLEKSRESAILAINVYNNPSTVFRSGGFIVLMNIAWTSLFHAIFEKEKVTYYYRDPKDRRKYLRIDGEFKAWELSTCIKEYFKGTDNPKYQNILFFIGLRNKIEHRFMPSIDPLIFGECQAYLINYEEILTREFGDSFALADTLLFALQYSRIKTEEQLNVLRSMQSKNFNIIKTYIDNFRKNLDSAIISNSDFSFRVFLIPKPANHQSSADTTIEFIKYDPSNPEEMEKYDHLVTLIKEKNVPTQVSIVSDPKDAKERVLLVDRGKTDSNQVVGVTRDPSKASGILVVEKLSEEIFNDITGIIEASSIMYKRFSEFPISDRAFYFVYSGRHNVFDEQQADLLLINGYQSYMPFYYWLLKVNQNKVRSFLEGAFINIANHKFYSIIRLLVAIGNESWINLLYSVCDKFITYAQKPQWIWHIKRITKNLQNISNVCSAIGLHMNSKLFDFTVKELVQDFDLANRVLSDKCLRYSQKENIDKAQLRFLDLIANYTALKSIVPNVDDAWRNDFLKTFRPGDYRRS